MNVFIDSQKDGRTQPNEKKEQRRRSEKKKIALGPTTV
jgi:hypothetical protein